MNEKRREKVERDFYGSRFFGGKVDTYGDRSGLADKECVLELKGPTEPARIIQNQARAYKRPNRLVVCLTWVL